MPISEISASEFLSLITHVKKWVVNLLRAKEKRKQESKEALRAVIKAVRETTWYIAHFRKKGKQSIEKEKELALLWTELSFKLNDLGLKRLSERCDISGKYWADTSAFDKDILERAGNRLNDIEQLALASLKDLDG